MTPNNPPIWRDLLWLTTCLILLFGAFLGSRPLMVPDEARYAEIPREMVESGNYLVPHLNYLPYFEKPALFYWLEAAAIKMVGVNNWALRGVVGGLSLLGCLMVYIAGLRLYDRRTGILACLMLATSMLYFIMARFIVTDMPFTVWLTTSMLLFILGQAENIPTRRRYYFWGMYALAALAMLTKGLIGIIIPGMVVCIWLSITRQWKQLSRYYLLSGTVLFLLIALPWHLLVQLHYPDFFRFYFIDQHFRRYVSDYAGREQAWWFLSAATLGGFFPWVCFLLAAPLNWAGQLLTFNKYATGNSSWGRLLLNRWQQHAPHPATLFFSAWAVGLLVFFNLSRSQLLTYALPIMPPLALLLARYFSLHWQHKADPLIRSGFLLIGLIGGLAGIATVVAYCTPALQLPTPLLYIGTGLLAISLLSSTLAYWYKNIGAGVTVLIISSGIFFVTGDLIYPHLDTRPILPLITALKPHLTVDSEVVSYHEYFQDLPVYLQKRVTVVGYQGELAFGIQHREANQWILDEQTFWQRWHNQAGMFMIMYLRDYKELQKQGMHPLYPLAQTDKVILLTNVP